jgi:hypothetical protein
MKHFKFTLRDLFWLVLVVGMGCAWWVEQRQVQMELTNARMELDSERYKSALAAIEHRETKESLKLVDAKLRETGFRWKYVVRFKQDGQRYVMLQPDP